MTQLFLMCLTVDKVGLGNTTAEVPRATVPSLMDELYQTNNMLLWLGYYTENTLRDLLPVVP